MTGFSRHEGTFENDEHKFSFVWEVKSVNAKGLDIKVKLPGGFDEIEIEIKNLISKNFTRGTFSAALTIKDESNTTNICIDQTMLNSLKQEVLKIYSENKSLFCKPSPTEFLRFPGVIQINENSFDDQTKDALYQALFQNFEQALKKLQTERKNEGEKIGRALLKILDEIEEKTLQAETIADGVQSQIREKISEQIKTLTSSADISSERLEQEVLFYVMRADVKEELERLKAHVSTAREIFEKGGTIGRKLDFLCQELNREANTLCSKSMDLTQTKIGMDLKALIEQFREQIQNME